MRAISQHVRDATTHLNRHRGTTSSHSSKSVYLPINSVATASFSCAAAKYALQSEYSLGNRLGVPLQEKSTSKSNSRRPYRNSTAVAAASPEMAGKTGLTLYSFSTPNGYKASVTLEELGLPYKLETLNISTNVQKEDWFLKINPNGRIPALVDHDQDDLAVFETGAIMIYLAEKIGDTDLLPKDPEGRYQTISWLMFQMGGIGPMQGQINFFARYSEEKSPAAIRRFLKETKRLYSVLESRLKDHPYLVQDKYTLADIANYCWVYYAPIAGIDLNEYPGVKKWVRRIAERPAVQKGFASPGSKWPLAAKLPIAVHDDTVYNEILNESKALVEV